MMHSVVFLIYLSIIHLFLRSNRFIIQSMTSLTGFFETSYRNIKRVFPLNGMMCRGQVCSLYYLRHFN